MLENAHILIVEDDTAGRDLLQTVFEFHNISHDIAKDAEQAVELLAENAYTAAIIDLSLPGMSGWQLLEHIHENPTTVGIPCVAITAFHSSKVAQAVIAAGFKAYFPKPLDFESFVRDLEQYVS